MEAIMWLFVGFISTELFSWWLHKYIMHGVLWNIHKSHHTKTNGFFELNDVFVVVFGSLSVLLILLGVEALDYRFWIGCGISTYGGLYFIFHDVLIHKRLKWFGRPRLRYLVAITEAHRAHHKSKERDNAESFGLFLVARKFFDSNERKEEV